MRAYEIQGSFGLSNLKRVDAPDPEPGPGEVLVRVRACSLNFRDLMMVRGEYNPRQPLPLVPLSDGVGEVAAVGAGVTRVRTGDRVAGIFAQRWLAGPFTPEARASTLGGPLPGMLRSHAVLGEDGLVKVHDYLSTEEAATLPCAALTAWHALAEEGAVRPGEWVLLLGSGGVSVFGLQLAKLFSARVVVVTGSPDKVARLRELGADAVIDRRAEPDWERKVQKLTGGGADVVLEVGGADTLARSLQAVRLSGRIMVIGVLSGVEARLPVTSILMKNVRLQGVFVGSREMFENLNRALAASRLRPVIDRVFDFEQAPEAFEALAAGRHFGKLVIRIAD
ncbi:MAG: NAD(P)-dependent alcohol dehydrogenase [Myxococcales bacterium]|nr:NAD(P)-dependent alcohol dehydrogenase [Myxococcales bacterium]